MEQLIQPAMAATAEVGPAGQSPEDTRLAALLSNRRAVASAQPPEEPSLVKALLPLVMAQAMDLISTEKPFGFLAHENTRELNPLPGMQSTAGRLGWGGLEAALGAVLLKKSPKIGKAYVTGGNLVHNALVENNRQATEDAQLIRRLRLSMEARSGGR